MAGKDPMITGRIELRWWWDSWIYMNWSTIVDSSWNIDAPVTSSDLTLSWTLDVTWATTLTGKLTADDVDLASWAVITWLWTWANGIKIKNPKNAAASALSWTQLDVEIDIGWTPYHFTVYPTKA